VYSNLYLRGHTSRAFKFKQIVHNSYLSTCYRHALVDSTMLVLRLSFNEIDVHALRVRDLSGRDNDAFLNTSGLWARASDDSVPGSPYVYMIVSRLSQNSVVSHLLE